MLDVEVGRDEGCWVALGTRPGPAGTRCGAVEFASEDERERLSVSVALGLPSLPSLDVVVF
jgi:hypothetical protein